LAVRRQVRLRLALPWLAEAVSAEAGEGAGSTRAPAAEWLLARGRPLSGHRADWRDWLLDEAGGPLGLLRCFPAGACVRALRHGSRPEGTWACARPVHLLTAIDHLQIAPATVMLDEEESATLGRDLNGHFADRGFVFHAVGHDRDWALECPAQTDCTSVEPAGLSGRNLRDLMPAGRDGAAIRSLTNEIQMLLHDHPVNVARAAQGLPVVNALWLWGFGRAGDATDFEAPAIYTDDAWLAGLWKIHGAEANSISDLAAGLERVDSDALLGWCGLPASAPGESIGEAERRCLAPARAALWSGAIDGLDMLLGERAFAVGRGLRLRFWRGAKPLEEWLA
jgi:hypothetical protein